MDEDSTLTKKQLNPRSARQNRKAEEKRKHLELDQGNDEAYEDKCFYEVSVS